MPFGHGFDILNNIAYNLNLNTSAAGLCDGCVSIANARNGMFGKRGETPPLPRNCERACLSNDLANEGLAGRDRET